VRSGSRILKPEMKYSATNIDPSRAKQNPSSIHIEVNTSGRSRPSRSMSDGEYDPRDGGEPPSASVEASIGDELRETTSAALGDAFIVCFEKVETLESVCWVIYKKRLERFQDRLGVLF
jgi:hypothetical protein